MQKNRADAGGIKIRVKFPLSVKLITIITIIVMISAFVISGLSSYFFMEDSAARVEENNLTMVQIFSAQMEAELQAVYASALSLLDTLRISSSKSFMDVAEQQFFTRNAHIAYIGVPGMFSLYNHKFFIANESDEQSITAMLEAKGEALQRANNGELAVLSGSAYFNIPVMLLAAPYTDGGSKNRIVVAFSTERIQAAVESETIFTTYALSQYKDLLVHPEREKLKFGISNTAEEILSRIYETPEELMQFSYTQDGVKYFIASQKISFGRFTAVSRVPAVLVYDVVKYIAVRNAILTAMVLLISILAVWFFAHGISRPVLALAEAAALIEQGVFNISLKPASRDEIGLLTRSFVKMGKGLAEREQLRETFGKFVNKEIADRAMKGELKLGGERKVATIFFSDIRSFTAISENMSPEDVVEFLNEYMTRMVDCIEQTHGVVDKFIGDAIMGVWGAPVSTGSPQKDALFAIKSMLLMRASLIEFNKTRGGPGKPILHIGCGLNTGHCLAGQIGSTQRMEYTVIGDAVNTASRIEALNKPFCTDILLSDNTYRLVKDYVITEPMPAIRVKGKKEPLQIYALVNYKNAEGPQTLDEVRRMLNITPPSQPLTEPEEEVKYEIPAAK
ncbi:MAG: adenylate/guanylate cyclase domain-containing protein [Treponema sp.]